MAHKKKLDSTSNRIEFHYTVSNSYQIIKVDGVSGNLNAKGEIQMSIFSEIVPLPKLEEYELTEHGNIGKRNKIFQVNNGLTRQIEATLRLDSSTARAIATWLNTRADELDRLLTDVIQTKAISTDVEEEIK